MGTRVTEAMIDGWMWEKNVLVSPNGRIHVVCERRSYENRDGSRTTHWSADVFVASRSTVPLPNRVPREYGGRVGGASSQPSRREAAIAALDAAIFVKPADRLPSDEDVAGLHPDFAKRLRESRAAYDANQADHAAHAAEERWTALQQQLADLPKQIDEVEASLPVLRLAADRAKLLRALAYEDREEAERIVLHAIAEGMDAEWKSGIDTQSQAQWVGWAAGWRDGKDRSLNASQHALAAAQQVQADCKGKLVHAAALAVEFAVQGKE